MDAAIEREPKIRKAAPADSSAVADLWHRCGLTRPWNDAQADFRRAVDGPASAVLLLDGTAEPAASVMVGFDGHRGWIYYLAVDPTLRRQGLGRRMMAAAEDWLRGRGAPKIQLMVREDNAAAIGFYQALGLSRQKVVTLGRFLEGERQ
jgi:ribosomal protein S18 acetylase RimI-like enzyme